MKNYFFLVVATLALLATPAFAEERIYQTGETSPMEFAKKFENQDFLLGGGGNVAISNSDVVDVIAGGVVKGRWQFFDFLSVEMAVEFNRLPVQGVDDGSYRSRGLSSDASGDIFAVPLLPALLIHLPPWGNMRAYIFGGVGYQFNDADDFEVEVTSRATGATGTLDVEVDDGVIGYWGGGVDIVLTQHLVLNFDARYQSAEFDMEAKGTVAGVPVVIEEEEENFDSVVLRGSLLYRF